MRKNRGLFWGVILFVATMLTACGSVPEPTQEDVLKALEKEGYITEESIDNEEVLVQMNEVKINDDKDGASVECVVTSETDVVRVNTEYKIRFEIKDDKESWKVKKVSTRKRTYELNNPIPEADLTNLLRWESVSTEDGYIYFDDSHTTYTVVNHEIQSAEMLDVVTVEVNGRLNLNNIKATVKYTVSYDAATKNWKIKDEELVSTEKSFVEGYIVELSGDRVLGDIISRSEYVHVAGTYYLLTDDNTTVSNIRIGEPVYDGFGMTVPASITVTAGSVSFDVHYVLDYYFDTYESQWEISWVNAVKFENFNTDVTGVWLGRIDNDQVVIRINNYSHESMTACLDVVIEITLAATGESYHYSAYVYEYVASSGALWIRSYEAIGVTPDNAYVASFDGYAVDGVYTPYSMWDDFYLEKVQ